MWLKETWAMTLIQPVAGKESWYTEVRLVCNFPAFFFVPRIFVTDFWKYFPIFRPANLRKKSQILYQMSPEWTEDSMARTVLQIFCGNESFQQLPLSFLPRLCLEFPITWSQSPQTITKVALVLFLPFSVPVSELWLADLWCCVHL